MKYRVRFFGPLPEDADGASTSGIQYTIKTDRRVLMPEVVSCDFTEVWIWTKKS